MKIKTQLLSKGNALNENDLGSIVYMTSDDFLDFASKDSPILKNAVVIVDEFDGLLFEEKELA